MNISPPETGPIPAYKKNFCFLPTLIVRHRKENLKKCSLRGLEEREDCIFLPYPCERLPNLESYLVLDVEGEEISEADMGLGLLLIDATWRYAADMMRKLSLPPTIARRSLPKHFRTAYPRYQTACALPDQGLASIEALYLAYRLMGRPTDGLLDNYHWKEEFLSKNQL